MEKQIKRYMPTAYELEGLDEIISKNPELRKIMQNGEKSLDAIIQAIDGVKSLGNDMKNTIKQFFIALQQTALVSDIYKFSTFKNQDLIEELLKREKKYIEIIEKLFDLILSG